MTNIADLEHRFTINGRGYHVHVVVDDPRPKPMVIANNDFDVAVFTCAKADLSDFECDEPHKVADTLVAHVVTFMPARPSEIDLGEFHDALLNWVMRHRGEAVLAHEDWEAERDELEWVASHDGKPPTN